MRLIVHCGLHKTASTNLQHLLHEHRRALAERGIFYQANPRFAAHHDIAWRLLAGDPAMLERLIAQAREANCHAAILSSEDLEGIFFDPSVARLIEDCAARAGAALEWHVVLREPGAAFASLFAQLRWHVYADALSLFVQIMIKGGLYMHDPAPDWGGTPFWYYSFDHCRDLDTFERNAGRAPIVHDYADDAPFPGWRLLERLDALDVVERMPDTAGQNRRHPAEQIVAGYRARILDAGGAALGDHIDTAIAASMASVADCARLIGARFAASHEAALARFALR